MHFVIINCLESLFMFLMISLMTWKLTNKDILNTLYFKLLYALCVAIFLTMSNAIQIISNILFPLPWSKVISIISFGIFASVLFSVLNNNFKKIHYYLVAVIIGNAVLFICDSSTIGVALIIVKSFDILFSKYYNLICYISIVLKFLLLILSIFILDPNFFKRQKEKGITYLASTITTISRTQASFPSWLWLHQPKAPKSLRKDDE